MKFLLIMKTMIQAGMAQGISIKHDIERRTLNRQKGFYNILS